MADKRDEKDIVAENKQLKADLQAAEILMAGKETEGQKAIEALKVEHEKVVATLNDTITTLNASIVEKDKAFLAAQESNVALTAKVDAADKKEFNFEKSVAHRVAELGIRSTPVPVPKEQNADEELSKLPPFERAVAIHARKYNQQKG